MTPAIRIENLVVRYRAKSGQSVDAVQGLSLAVEQGEVVGFLGPNGAGKSSTLKALMGFVEPAAGRAWVFEHEAGTLAAKEKVGYLPEVALYYPFLTPLETLTLYGELQGICGSALQKEAMSLLETVGLADHSKKLNRTLSKGMLQRVGIAQALLGSPDLLVLDEVTSGLDPIGRKELRELLLDRKSQGATLLFSSHELAEVEMLCDRILLINSGRLIEERVVDELKDELRRFDLVYSGNASMVGLTDRLTQVDDGIVQARFDSKEHLLQAIDRVQKAKGQILDVTSEEGSLEEYFIERVQRAA